MKSDKLLWYNVSFDVNEGKSTMEKRGEALAVGEFVPYKMDLSDVFSEITDYKDGVCRFGFHIENSEATGFVFRNFFIPEGLEMFVYSPGYQDVRGGFSFMDVSENDFYIHPLNGDSVIFEINGDMSLLQSLNVEISEVLVLDEPVYIADDKGFGGSEACEINVNCSEGNMWDLQKKAVVRILLRKEGAAYWCTGTLVNNTNNDYHPYLLTADHCGNGASEYELTQWVFYFNYAFADCNGATLEPEHHTMTGCRLVASGGNEGHSGSDFYLVELFDEVPFSYDPYFCGWDRSLTGATYGITIHHPHGDVKKISAFHSIVTTSDWNGSGVYSHWEVVWGDTENGHGVTEGGSSGAPLINPNGNITGTLTGGLAACTEGLYGPGTGPFEPDFFGKFCYSWDQNGTLPTEQLAPWLDPQGLNPTQMPGLYNSEVPVAAFSSDTAVIIGETLSFTDLSQGTVQRWEWYFEGGSPQTSTQQNPVGISYDAFGSYDVRLIASNDTWADTLLVKDYVRVVSNIFPVPASDKLFVHLGNNFSGEASFNVYNSFGRQILPLSVTNSTSKDYSFSLGNLAQGIFYLEIITDDFSEIRKFMIIR